MVVCTDKISYLKNLMYIILLISIVTIIQYKLLGDTQIAGPKNVISEIISCEEHLGIF